MNKDVRVILVYPDYSCSKVFKGPNLPVGLGYIAKALETARIEYEVIDLTIDSIDELMHRIDKFCPQFLGISMMSYCCNETYKLLTNIKHTFQGRLKIIAGGPHLTANRESVLMDCPIIDIGIVGEGEAAIIEIVLGNPLATVKGALYRECGEIKYTGEREFIHNLDGIPFPTYKGFKLEKYGICMQLASSRGCPYKCIYCGAPKILGKRWRHRSVRGMIEEFEYWYGRGYRHFCFNDSNFAINKSRVLNFCEEIIKRGLDVYFTSEGLRADHVDRQLLEKIHQAGFTSLTFGVESGSNKILRNLKKGETREQIESAIAAATSLRFDVTLFFLIGSPGENIKDIKQSFRLARKYNVARVYFFNLTPIPGTEFYDWAVKQGYLDEYGGKYPEDNFAFSSKACFRTDVMTIDQLTMQIKQAHRIEQQILRRRNFQQYLAKVIGRKVQVNNFFFNFLSRSIIAHACTARWLRNLGGLRRKI